MKADAALLRQVNTHVRTMRAAAAAIRELLQLPEASETKGPARAGAGRKAIDDTAAHRRMIELMRSEGITIPEAARRVAAESGKTAGQESEAKRLERGLRDRLDKLSAFPHKSPLEQPRPSDAILAAGLRRADGFVAFTAEILPMWLRQLAADCEAMADATEAARQRLARDVEAITDDAPAAPVRRRRSPGGSN